MKLAEIFEIWILTYILKDSFHQSELHYMFVCEGEGPFAFYQSVVLATTAATQTHASVSRGEEDGITVFRPQVHVEA